MSLEELAWFHPRLMDAALRADVRPIHEFMGASGDAPLTDHAIGRNGLVIEGSKHWEYTYAIRRAGLAAVDPGIRVLDAGCGRSAFPAYLASRGIRVHGVDRNGAAVECLRPYGVQLMRADLAALPYREGAFDQVLCISVLEHTPDPLRCFDELWRVTGLGGTLTVTGDYAPWGLPPRTAAAGRVMNHGLLRRLVGADGVVPAETPDLLNGLGYFPQMWPTVLPVYLRFVKDAAAPPDHGAPASASGAALGAGPLDPPTRRHLALQCYRAARHYLHHRWLPEARALFDRAWGLDRRLLRAVAWGLVARLPGPLLRPLHAAWGTRKGGP